MKKSTKRLLIAAGVGAGLLLGASALTSKMLVSVAVKREGLKLKVPHRLQSRVSGGLLDDPKLKNVAKARKKAMGLETETVSIKSRDGLKLVGHIYGCEKPKRIVLAMHGWRSDWMTDFGSCVDFLHDEGSIMICPDQRGQNDSEGEYISFGVLERYDCIDWLRFVNERYPGDVPIYLLGVSMGASTVLMATGEGLSDRVKGVIADCGFTSPHAIWKHVLDNNLKIKEKLTYPLANAIIKRKAMFDGDGYSTIDALKVNTRPVLFIHGSNDGFVPISMAFENYLATVAPKQLFIVPGAGHGMSYLTDTQGYQTAVREFFEKCENNGFDQNNS